MRKIILIAFISIVSVSKGLAQEEGTMQLTKDDLKEIIISTLLETRKNTEQFESRLLQYQGDIQKDKEEAIMTNTKQNVKMLVNTLKSSVDLSPETTSSLNEAVTDIDNVENINDLNKSVEKIALKINELIKLNEKESIGTFKLLKKGKNIPIYEDKENNGKNIDISKVSIEIKDGVIYDVIAIVNDNQFFFNKSTTSIFSFNKKGSTLRLYNNLNTNKQEEYIELVDLVGFEHKNGKRYVIENANIDLSLPDNESHTISIDNNLKSVIDFRIYSDFLGLIDEAPNGIVSFEGSSTFYLNPFSVFRSYSYLFKKLKTKVRYSRLDEDDKTISPILNDKLDLLQKSFLNFGGELDLYEIRFGKKFPYKLISKVKGALDITEIGDEESKEEIFNTTTLGLGIGVEIHIERYHNFGLHTSFYFNRYQNNNIIKDSILNFNTFAINSEVYFYTPGSKNDAIFLRAQYEQGMRDLTPSSNFFTIQFGYKAELNFKSKKEK